MAVRHCRPVRLATRKLSRYEQGKPYDMRGIALESCDKPNATNPRARHAKTLENEPGVKADEILWRNGTPGHELIIRDYFAEGGSKDVNDEGEESEFDENPIDLISEDEYRQFLSFDSSDEEIKDEQDQDDFDMSEFEEDYVSVKDGDERVSMLKVHDEDEYADMARAAEEYVMMAVWMNGDEEEISEVPVIYSSDDDSPNAAISEATMAALENERTERQATAELDELAARLTPVRQFGGWASGCDTLRQSRMGNRSDGLRGSEPKIRRVRHEETGEIIGEASEIAIRRGRKLMANRESKWLNGSETNQESQMSTMWYISGDWDIEAEEAMEGYFVDCHEAVTVQKYERWMNEEQELHNEPMRDASMDDDHRGDLERHNNNDRDFERYPGQFRDSDRDNEDEVDRYHARELERSLRRRLFDDEPMDEEPSIDELEREAEVNYTYDLAWTAIKIATDWNGRINNAMFQKELEHMKRYGCWSYITIKEVEAIFHDALDNALYQQVIESAFKVDDETDIDETGGRKPWWYGRKTAREIECVRYKRLDRTHYRHNDKPVRVYTVSEMTQLEDGTKVRVPVDAIKETELRRMRRQLLAEQTLLVA